MMITQGRQRAQAPRGSAEFSELNKIQSQARQQQRTGLQSEEYARNGDLEWYSFVWLKPMRYRHEDDACQKPTSMTG